MPLPFLPGRHFCLGLEAIREDDSYRRRLDEMTARKPSNQFVHIKYCVTKCVVKAEHQYITHQRRVCLPLWNLEPMEARNHIVIKQC